MDPEEIKQIVDDITEQMEITWGGSGFERVVFEWIIQHVPMGSVMVEIGAGFVSTKCLSVWGELYSIEHDERFTEPMYPTNYIIALKDYGYDWQKIGSLLPPKEDIRLVLIDGIDRRSVLANLHLFNKDAIYLVHDTNRLEEAIIARELAVKLGRECAFHTNGDYWATI